MGVWDSRRFSRCVFPSAFTCVFCALLIFIGIYLRRILPRASAEQRQEEKRSLGVAMASNQRTSVLHESRSTPPQLQQVQVQQQDAAQTQDTPHHVDFHSVAAIVARIEQDCQTLANGFEQVVDAYTKSLQESAISTAKHLEIQERAAVGMGQDAQACAAAADALVAQCQRLRARVGEIEHLADRAHELRDAVDALSKHV